MAKIIPFCSSSRGNCTLVCVGGEYLLIDVGCSTRALKNYLGLFDLDIEMISAILITHEHTDHINGLNTLTKNYDIPVYGSERTLVELIKNNKVSAKANLLDTSELHNFKGNTEIKAFRTPHDSVESVGYSITYDGYKISYCTDLGHISGEVRENVIHSNFVFLEANYDTYMLQSNVNYPFYIKKRISSDYGHLSNDMSADFAVELVKSGTSRLILGHLSPENNTPELAFTKINSALEREGMILNQDYTLSVAKMQTTGEYVTI